MLIKYYIYIYIIYNIIPILHHDGYCLQCGAPQLYVLVYNPYGLVRYIMISLPTSNPHFGSIQIHSNPNSMGPLAPHFRIPTLL